MKKVGLVLVGFIVLTVGILSVPKREEQKLFIDNGNMEDTSLVFMIQEEDGSYNQSNTLPNSGYTFNASKSVCSNGTIPTWEDNKLYFNDLTKNGTSCYLYFDIKPLAMNSILANKEIRTRDDFSTTVTEDTTGIIYEAEDDDGTTYYFAGAPTDNWVYWAGFYWRIIRINGDGTIRLIYNGTSTTTTGTGTQISTSAFNSTYSDNMYVGFKYTSGNVHGTGTNSTILTALNSWYSSNLASYADDIDMNAGFCNDRQPSTSTSSSNGSGGTGTTTTYYGAYIRLVTNKTPTFECQNSSDLFTVSSSNKGNKALQYPIGLITADEVAYAGGVNGSTNSSYYLYTNQVYWTMSPCLSSGGASVFRVYSGGQLAGGNVTSTYGVRPVINLKADVQISGSGTSTDPYLVEGAE